MQGLWQQGVHTERPPRRGAERAPPEQVGRLSMTPRPAGCCPVPAGRRRGSSVPRGRGTSIDINHFPSTSTARGWDRWRGRRDAPARIRIPPRRHQGRTAPPGAARGPAPAALLEAPGRAGRRSAGKWRRAKRAVERGDPEGRQAFRAPVRAGFLRWGKDDACRLVVRSRRRRARLAAGEHHQARHRRDVRERGR